jgi:hypothetical protein
MKKILIIFSVFISCIAAVVAQPVMVKVSPLKMVGQKAVVELTMTNSGTNKIEAARAVCFVLDQNGQMVGQSAKWVIGQNRTSLEPHGQAKFNFVITAPHPLMATNLAVKVNFSRVILQGGKQVNPQNDVTIVPSSSQSVSKTNAPIISPAR